MNLRPQRNQSKAKINYNESDKHSFDVDDNDDDDDGTNHHESVAAADQKIERAANSAQSLVLKLSALENERDGKRRELENLFEDMQSIRKKMERIENNLHEMDDEISALEQELECYRDHGNQIQSQVEAPPMREENSNVPAGNDMHDNTVASRSNSYFETQLTDPLTVPEHDDPPILTRTSSITRSRTSNKDQLDIIENPNTSAEECKSSSKPKGKTIDSFFNKNDSNNIGSVKVPQAFIGDGTRKDAELQKQTEINNPYRINRNSVTTTNGNQNNDISNHQSFSSNSNQNVIQNQATSSLESSSIPTSKPQHFDMSVMQYSGGNTLAPPNSLFALRHAPSLEPNNDNSYMQTLATSEYPWSQNMMKLLQKTFHIQSFRDHQKEIINCTLSGNDAFVIMRTGGGKSLTYQLPACIEGRYNGQTKKITLVISPLLSLIHDQVEQMNEFVPNSALSFTSGIGTTEHNQRWAKVRDPNAGVCMIFATPEKVHKSNKLRNELEKLYDQNRLGRFVIDECHCASQWGHDFRPDYTKLGILKSHFPSVPLIAVTATASDKVREDCCRILRLGTNYQLFRSTANRPNLTYSIIEKADGKDKVVAQIADFITTKYQNKAGIIYTFSRKEADEVADKLCTFGIIARSYHSNVSQTRKEQIHRSWMRNQTQVVVATIAFGLGINKPDVRFVLHHSLSKSLENYYQESGRAGRDGKAADCVLYYSAKDVARMLCMIHGESNEGSFWSMVRYAQTAGKDLVCRDIILRTLGEVQTNRNEDDLEEIKNETTDIRDVTAHAKTVTQLVYNSIESGKKRDRLTLNQLTKDWRSSSSSAPEFLKQNKPGSDLNKEECERLIVSLLLEDILHPNIVFTSFATNMYIVPGPKAEAFLVSEKACVKIRFPKRTTKKRKAPGGRNGTKKSLENENGWMSTKKSKTSSTSKKKSKRKTPNSPAIKSKDGGQTKTLSSKAKRKGLNKRKSMKSKIIVELLASSSSEEEELEFVEKPKTRRLEKINSTCIEEDDSSEYEF